MKSITRKKSVCIFTGSRAEYGLLYPLIKEIGRDKDLKLKTIVSGTHLSPEFGFTVDEIERDGVRIDKKVEMLLSADTPAGITKSLGLGLIGYSDTINDIKPDLIILLGDRFETFAMAVAAMIARIPIAHIHGGETTQGAIDEPLRHSITKMAQLHFTSTEEYRKRIIQLGENPHTVFNVGAIGVESIRQTKLMKKCEFEQSVNFNLKEKNILVTFHPVTLENKTAGKQFTALLNAIEELENTGVIFTKPNADAEGRIIINLIDEFVAKNIDRASSFTSLGQVRYLSALKYVDAVVGNSSSGIIEAPSFKIGTINIGDRQRGRVSCESVINCRPDKTDIARAFKKLFSSEFKSVLNRVKNPYELKGTVKKILSVIKLKKISNTKKKFFDIDFVY